MIAKGTAVQQVMPAPIEGLIAGYQLDQELGAILYLVEWQDADGVTHSRYFKADEIAPKV